MKKKNQRKLIELLKELDLYRKGEVKARVSIDGGERILVTSEIYIRLNDVIDWEELIS